jgi:hypothetical protein
VEGHNHGDTEDTEKEARAFSNKTWAVLIEFFFSAKEKRFGINLGSNPFSLLEPRLSLSHYANYGF